jgi:hypothetical protein
VSVSRRTVAVMAASPRSTLDELLALADELGEALAALLDVSGIREEDLNPPGSSIMVVGIPWFWEPLTREHQPLVAAAQRLLDLWEELTVRAVAAGAPSRVERFREHRMRAEGFEPPRPLGHEHLKLARQPIAPRPRRGRL